MKIAYIIFHDIRRNDGVTKKVANQIAEWEIEGHEVNVYCFLPERGSSILKSQQYPIQSFIESRLVLNKTFIRDVNSQEPDLVYFRYDTWNRNLTTITRGKIAISELNTLDLKEFKTLLKIEGTIKSMLRYYTYLLGRNLVFKQLDGLVGVTNEIVEDPMYAKFRIPSKVVPNSIDLDKYSPVKSDTPAERIGLFFIGTPGQPWHGVDIIVEWARNLKEFDFHVVGIDDEDTDNLFYHGYLDRNVYLEILKKSQICIGSLALWRNEMYEACPLKVREYLAYGFPAILGYRDTSFLDQEYDFILSLSKDELFDYDRIRNFIKKNVSRIVDNSELDGISSSKVENARLHFFNQIVKKNDSL